MNIEFAFGVPIFANPGLGITPGCAELETASALLRIEGCTFS
jgi:hypothetical protein